MSTGDQHDANSAAVSSPAERRRHLRFHLSATVEAIDIETGANITGRTSDLSLGGCYVDTLNPFALGTEIKIRIIRGTESFEANAKVVFSLMGMGMGLAFVSAQPKQIQLFQRWVQEISGPPAETTEKPQTWKNVVLGDLIATLMHKKVLTESEGKDMLRKLFL